METLNFRDGNIFNLINKRHLDFRRDANHDLHMHSSLIRRLSQERELEGHQGCVNTVAWNSKGSLLISGSDDTQINIWSYSTRRLLHSIETGHSTNIFCTKFVPETSDELVASGAGDAEVRLFNLSHIGGRGSEETAISPLALFQCHTSRVKKLAVEAGNPNVVWSASEDGTLRQHDLRECASCPPAGSSHQECRNVLAARYDDLEDVISFVSAGISLDSKDSQGRTANGHDQIVEYLINSKVPEPANDMRQRYVGHCNQIVSNLKRMKLPTKHAYCVQPGIHPLFNCPFNDLKELDLSGNLLSEWKRRVMEAVKKIRGGSKKGESWSSKK